MPTRSITTTTRISAPADSCHVNCGIFEDRLNGRVEGVLNLLAIVGDTLVFVKLVACMTVE